MQKGLPNRLNAKILDVLGGPIRSSRDKTAASLFRTGSSGIAYDFTNAASLLWRYNLLSYTEDFSNAVWAKTSVTVATNVTVAPDGTMTADALTPTGTGFLVQMAYAINTSGTYTTSVSVKDNGAGSCLVSMGSGTIGYLINVDLVTGAFISGRSYGGGTLVGYTITSQGNGWWRVTVSATAAVGGVYVSSADGTSPTQGIYIWGAQLELGSTATAYQKITDPNIDAVPLFPKNPLYQDTAGTTAITLPDQTIGMALDTSRGLVLGPERSPDVGYDNPAAWTVQDASIQVSGGQLSFSSTPTLKYCFVNLPVGAGKTNKVIISVASVTAGALVVEVNGVNSTSITSAGTYEFILGPSTVGGTVGVRSSGTTTAVVNSFSVKEVSSVPLIQANAGLRPKWGRAPTSRRNLLTYTQQLDNAAWTKSRSTVTANATTAPDSTTTAALMIPTAVLGTHRAYQIGVPNLATQNWTLSAYLKPSGYNKARLMVSDGSESDQGRAIFDLTDGTITPEANVGTTITVVSSSATPVGSGWYRCSITVTVTSAETAISAWVFSVDGSGTSFTGDGVSGTLIWGAQLEIGSSATNYQKVTNQFDITEAGVPAFGFARFDRSDDIMSATIPVAQTGDVLVFGRSGSWIEPGVTYGAGSTWSVGVNTVTGLPAGLLAAIGDVVGIVAIGRTLSATERQQALEYHKGRGAAGWLVAGAELVTNGDFSAGTTGWAVVSGDETLSVVSGRLRVTLGADGLAGSSSGAYQTIPGLTVGAAYALRVGERLVGTNGAVGVRLFTSVGSTQVTQLYGFTNASNEAAVFVTPVSTLYLQVYSGYGTAGTYVEADDISIKPLTVAP